MHTVEAINEKDPGEQYVQLGEPASEYIPGVQFVQLLAAISANVPAKQERQDSFCATGKHNG